MAKISWSEASRRYKNSMLKQKCIENMNKLTVDKITLKQVKKINEIMGWNDEKEQKGK